MTWDWEWDDYKWEWDDWAWLWERLRPPTTLGLPIGETPNWLTSVSARQKPGGGIW